MIYLSNDVYCIEQIENTDNINILHNALIIAKSILTTESIAIRKERALLFISDDHLINNLLQFEEYFITQDLNNETIIEIYYQVLTKISFREFCHLNEFSLDPNSL